MTMVSSLPTGPIGVILPTFPQQTTPSWTSAARDGADPLRELGDLCRDLEGTGIGALWTCDHLFWHSPCLESLVALTVAATATTQVTLGTCVLQLPLRHPAVVAKQMASLQALAGDRIVLGVGVGSHPGEYDAAGAEYGHRGRDLDAGLATVRSAWTGAPAASGDRAYPQRPAPRDLPIWVGGSSAAALRRAARAGDGWIPLFVPPDEYAASVERLAKEVDRAGRSEGAVTPAMVLFTSVDDSPEIARERGTAWMSGLYGLPARAFDRHLVAGPPGHVAEVVERYCAAGARHVVLDVAADDPRATLDRLLPHLPQAGDRAGR